MDNSPYRVDGSQHDPSVEVQALNAAASKRALRTLKDALGRDGIFALLRSDIEASNTFWRDVVARSTPGRWEPNTAHVVFPGDERLNAVAFVTWLGSDTGDPDKLIAGHPEHYFESVDPHPTEPGVLTAVILEAWAGKVTSYRIPRYAAPDRQAMPFLQELPGFSVQAAGQGVLEDGTAFAVAHNSFKDRDGGGVEAVLTAWVPDGTPKDVRQAMREHQAVEFTNWLAAAERDILTGIFKPPTP